MITKPEILLVAGTGRNSGKTTLICAIIKAFKQHSIASIKISSHFHSIDETDIILINRKDLYVGIECNLNKQKDSSLMLKAGALKSFFVMSSDEYLMDALQIISQNISPNTPIICESGGLRKYIVPGIFLMMSRSDSQQDKVSIFERIQQADQFITFNGTSIDFNIHQIQLSNKRWNLRKQI